MLTADAAVAGRPGGAIRSQASRLLRRSWAWGQLRRVQHEGLVRSVRRHRLWTRVLPTAPVVTRTLPSPAPYELHLVCHFADYLPAIWGLKSYLCRVGADAHLYIHVQGHCTAVMGRRLRHHFPCAAIITQPAADSAVVPELQRRGLKRLEALRAASAVMLKLVDVAVIGRLPRILVLDGDVFFFSRPDELHEALLAEGPLALFQRDAFTCYVMTPGEAMESFRIDLAERINTGIVAIDRHVIDLDLCERLVAHPAFSGGWVEQSLYALSASAAGHVRWLPSTYALSMEEAPEPRGIISRHYSGPSRVYMTEAGMPWLLRHGLAGEPAGAVE